MMRSLYSGVSGLKTHQTKMDVIGNNIANVNTTAYKSKSINFTDLLYQTTQAATGPNAETNTAGQNARQIGLGVKTGAISTSITTQGANQTTGNPFDLKITGESFFVVSDGTNTYFTRDGSFNTDSLGYLTMANTGYSVMGWGTDANDEIVQSTVQRLRIDTTSTYDAAATTQAYMSGILDKYDSQLDTTNGRQLSLQVYDNRGYAYNVKFSILPVTSSSSSTKNVTNTERQFTIPASVQLVDNAEVTYKMADNSDLTSTVIPDGLLDAIKATADASRTPGAAQDVTVKLDAAFFAAHTDVTLDPASTLNDQTITVKYTAATGYEGFDASGNSLGIMDVPAATITELYGTAPTVFGAAGAQTATNATINVTQKTYSDGTDSQYTYTYGTNTPTFAYENIAKLLATDTSPRVLSQTTGVESTTTTQKQEGQFTISVLGMTDSNGDAVDITNLGNTTQSLIYNTDNGNFSYVGAAGSNSFTLALGALGGNFANVTVDMSATMSKDNSKTSTIGATRGDIDGKNAGRKIGEMTGVSIGTDGTITAAYSNSMTRVLGQIAVANFANASGLANAGNNCYEATSNSGDFDGVGDVISADGSYMTSGCLEMSNVDLSSEFTEMITCQRGFQANSRIITVSDTLLEELVNLKR